LSLCIRTTVSNGCISFRDRYGGWQNLITCASITLNSQFLSTPLIPCAVPWLSSSASTYCDYGYPYFFGLTCLVRSAGRIRSTDLPVKMFSWNFFVLFSYWNFLQWVLFFFDLLPGSFSTILHWIYLITCFLLEIVRPYCLSGLWHWVRFLLLLSCSLFLPINLMAENY
jgi:hypothetical protein